MSKGIYKIVNKLNGKFYLGSALDIEKRWSNHLSTLRNNKHPNSFLQNSWNKYGEENFNFLKFLVFKEEKELNEIRNVEQKLLDKFFKSDSLYNINKNANGFTRESSIKARKKMKNTLKSCSEGGKIGGRIAKESGQILNIRTFESCSKGGRKGGLTNKESGQVYEQQKINSENLKKDVELLDINSFEVLKTFPSGKEAAEFLNVSPTCISAVCNGKQKTTKGYKLRFKK